MDFWDRVQLKIDAENTTYSYIAEKLGKRESTISGWHKRIADIVQGLSNLTDNELIPVRGGLSMLC